MHSGQGQLSRSQKVLCFVGWERWYLDPAGEWISMVLESFVRTVGRGSVVVDTEGAVAAVEEVVYEV